MAGAHLLAASNLVIAAGLVILAAAHGIAGLVIAWAVLGIGIGMGLYDPAFAALTWLYGREARSAITGITLIAGFASTIGWPLSALFLHEFGWRAACLIWAGLNILLAAPVNWLAIPRQARQRRCRGPQPNCRRPQPPRGAMPILAFFFAATWFVQGAMAAHLPGLLQGGGCVVDAAIAAAALVGPAQVGARLVEFGLLRSFHPVSSARIAAVLHPIGAAFLVVFGAPGDHRVRAVARRRQRHDHDRQGHLAVGVVRAARLRAAQRVALGASPGAAVGRAVSVRPVARPGRGRGGVACRPGSASPPSAHCSRCAPAVYLRQAPRRPAAEPHSIIPSTSALD